MKSVILGGDQGNVAIDQYCTISYSISSWDANANRVYSIVPVNGTLSNFKVQLSSAPGSGDTRTFTLYKNGSPTALTVSIAESNLVSSIDTSEVAVVAGDTIQIFSEFTGGTPASANANWYFTFDGVSQPIFGGVDNALLTSGTEYNGIMGGDVWGNTDRDRGVVFPTSGTLKNLRVQLTVAPGSGDTRTFTIMKAVAGSTTYNATTLDLSIGESDTTGLDASEVTVTAGDKYIIRTSETGAPADSYASWGIEFTPDIAGESIQLLGTTDSPLGGSTEYIRATHGINHNWGSETSRDVILPACTIKNLYIEAEFDPGSAPNSRTFTFRDDASSTNVEVLLTDGETTDNDTINTASVAEGSLCTIMHVPASSPTTNTTWMGFVTVIAGAGWANTINLITSPASVNEIVNANISTISGI